MNRKRLLLLIEKAETNDEKIRGLIPSTIHDLEGFPHFNLMGHKLDSGLS